MKLHKALILIAFAMSSLLIGCSSGVAQSISDSVYFSFANKKFPTKFIDYTQSEPTVMLASEAFTKYLSGSVIESKYSTFNYQNYCWVTTMLLKRKDDQYNVLLLTRVDDKSTVLINDYIDLLYPNFKPRKGKRYCGKN